MLERRARNGQSRPCPRRCELGKAPVRSSAAKTALRSSPVLRWRCVRAQKMERELAKWCACVEEQWHGSKARDAGETAAALLLLLFFAARARGRRQRARVREWGSRARAGALTLLLATAVGPVPAYGNLVARAAWPLSAFGRPISNRQWRFSWPSTD